ncbi:MAG TPA: serine/threonine-protein kinase [Polyangiales bacterium]|nr:serine/threonine-protein kinase [Polyangiales bacterium]
MDDPNSSIERVRRGKGSATTPYTDSQSREEMRAFLQKRVASFGLLLAGVFGMFMTWRVLNTLFEDDSPSRAYLPWQALSVSAFLAVWLSCRTKPRSESFIRSVEFAGLCVAGGGAILMCSRISYAARPDAVLLLCMTYTLIARAIMVPSTPARTLLYGAFFMLPFLIAVYFIHAGQHDPRAYTLQADPRLRLDAATLARRWTVIDGLWWVASLLITTSTSKVIYGLHQQVRDARRLGQYTLLEKLGQGGMGVVYRARHAMLRRPSAIKLLPPDKFGLESVARFEREVQLTASLSHPNTVRVFDYGRTPDGIFYYVMEFLQGASLDEVVAETGPLPPGRVIHILDQVAGALGEAHGIGLIHRDIKPANIFLTQQGGVPDVAKVLDFGLVKQVAQGTGEETTLQALTHDDSFSGTPLYMAPESITAPESIDPRTDLYSLGAVGYYLLTGNEVFGGRNIVEICSHHLHSIPVPPSQRSGRPLPNDLEALILQCLHKDPAQRPSDARTFQAGLRACGDARSWSEEDAQRWFAAHGAALDAKQSRRTMSGAPTIAVDLGRRATGPAGQRRAG